MSEENYRNLSQQIGELRKDMTDLRKDMDARFEKVDGRFRLLESKMVTKSFLIASIIVPLVAINLAFLAFAIAAIMDIVKG